MAAKGTSKTGEKGGSTARFVSKFAMSDVIADEMSRLIGSPTRSRNWRIAFAAFLVVMIVMYVMTSYRNIFVSIALFVCAMGSWVMAEQYPIRQQRRLRRLGFAESDKSAGELRCVAEVFEDHVDWQFGQGGEVASYPLSELQRARHNSIMCLLDFGNDRLVPIPSSSMAKNKYQGLTRMIDGLTAKK